MGQVDLEYETELIWRYDPGWTDITIATGVCLYGPLTLAFIADAKCVIFFLRFVIQACISVKYGYVNLVS